MTATQSPTTSRPVVRGHTVTTVHTCGQGRECVRCDLDEDFRLTRSDDR